MAEVAVVTKKFTPSREDGLETTKHEGLSVYPQFQKTGLQDVLLLKVEEKGKVPYWRAYLVRDIDMAYNALETKAQQSELVKKHEELRARAEKAEDDLKATQVQLQTAQDQIQSLTQQCSNLEGEAAVLDAFLGQKEEEAQQRLFTAEARIEALESEREGLVDQLCSSQEQAQQEIEALQARVRSLEEEDLMATERVVSRNETIANLRAELESKKLKNRFKKLLSFLAGR